MKTRKKKMHECTQARKAREHVRQVIQYNRKKIYVVIGSLEYNNVYIALSILCSVALKTVTFDCLI